VSERGSDGRRRCGPAPAVDFADLADGYQFEGKTTRIRAWSERREARKFAAYCNLLRVRKRARAIMAEGQGSPRYERLRAQQRAWAHAHREYETARRKAWRLRQRKSEGVVVKCGNPECAAQWCPAPARGTGRFVRFCSPTCFNRARYLRRKARLGAL
jgi:hypothetical protein